MTLDPHCSLCQVSLSFLTLIIILSVVVFVKILKPFPGMPPPFLGEHCHVHYSCPFPAPPKPGISVIYASRKVSDVRFVNTLAAQDSFIGVNPL